MMITKVNVKEIKANPFQSRRSQDLEAIRSLADEIKEQGLWTGALRGRKHNGHVELCFGHRRLEAVKRLQWKEVEVDLLDLSDEDMALQALIENLQREGLNDADKGDGIKNYIILREKSSPVPAETERALSIRRAKIKDEIGRILGLSRNRIDQLLKISGFDEDIKEEIRKENIAGKTAAAADRIGGKPAVKAVAKKGLGYRAMEAIGEEYARIEEPKVQERVRQKLVAGKISTADDVVKEARKARGHEKKDEAPPDLLIVIGNWTVQIKAWNKQLDEVIPYKDYLDTQPGVAERFRAAVSALVERLEKFV